MPILVTKEIKGRRQSNEIYKHQCRYCIYLVSRQTKFDIFQGTKGFECRDYCRTILKFNESESLVSIRDAMDKQSQTTGKFVDFKCACSSSTSNNNLQKLIFDIELSKSRTNSIQAFINSQEATISTASYQLQINNLENDLLHLKHENDILEHEVLALKKQQYNKSLEVKVAILIPTN